MPEKYKGYLSISQLAYKLNIDRHILRKYVKLLKIQRVYFKTMLLIIPEDCIKLSNYVNTVVNIEINEPKSNLQKWFTLKEFGNIYSVSPVVVAYWGRKGYLKMYNE